MIYVLLGVGGTSPTDLERLAKQGSLDLPYSKEDREGLGGTRAIRFVSREMHVANREGHTYPFWRGEYCGLLLV